MRLSMLINARFLVWCVVAFGLGFPFAHCCAACCDAAPPFENASTTRVSTTVLHNRCYASVCKRSQQSADSRDTRDFGSRAAALLQQNAFRAYTVYTYYIMSSTVVP